VKLKREDSLTCKLAVAKGFEVGGRGGILCRLQWLLSQGMFRGNSWLCRHDLK